MTTVTRNKTKQQILLMFLLDESASMENVREETVISVNKYFSGLKKKRNVEFLVTFTTFNSLKSEPRFTTTPIKNIPTLNNSNYIPNNSTPLYDAIGNSITSADAYIAKQKRAHRRRPQVLMVIHTDGQENMSRRYNQSQIKEMIQTREKSGWNFVYMGVGKDAWGGGFQLGIKRSNTVHVNNDIGRTMRLYSALSASTANYAASTVKFAAGNRSRGVNVTANFFTDNQKTEVGDTTTVAVSSGKVGHNG